MVKNFFFAKLFGSLSASQQNIGEFIVILLCKVIVHLFVFLPIFDFIDFDYIAEKLV